MDITYLGHASFLLKSKEVKLVIDPFSSEMMGLKFSKIEADVVTVSHQHEDHNAVSQVGGDPLVIDIPGEYEINGVRIHGFDTYHDKSKGEERGENTIFKFDFDGLTILHCGDLGHPLSAETTQDIDGVDVVMVPVGGVYTIDADEARQIVEKLEPSIVIPMHYRDPKLKPNISKYSEMAPVEDFLQKVGVTQAEPVKKLSIKKSDLGEEEMKIVVMEASA